MKIAYVMSRFPLLSETFILREMVEMDKLGYDIRLYPLICQDQPVAHEEAKKWLERANCIPFLSAEIFAENVAAFLRNPIRYLSILFEVVRGNLSSFDFLTKGLYLFPKAVYTAKRLRAEGIEHIHAHYATHPALLAWIVHKLTGISYSITVHSHDIYDCHAMLGTKLRGARFIATISNYNINYMANLLGEWTREKCHIVRCGIDPLRFTPAQSERGKIFKILQIGTLHWKKDQVTLIKAAARLRGMGVPFQLTIIGEGEERPKIEAEIKKSNAGDLVVLAGAKTQSEVAQLLRQADCYIQSSVSEGIPVAIMEALACELPVVATKITGIPELVLHEKTGLLVEPGNIQDMANALQFMYLHPDQARDMARNGREWVLKEFTLQGNISRLAALFQTTRLQPFNSPESA
ncbi:MAG: colanic acid biosynthesis glycosyltransferase WcaL [Chloroflexi bacterium]|nr:colanic acid biosynthesis glycosyltransferase WcaL [Chloroflexi bacterium CFX2]MCQ3936878.1 colanic acid biosynthesis glycosyltransferase WcaL [Chloroflexota bacterium]MDL1941510.1 glycosyltransferase family 4 protein [Chloroflexi bacterium CFX2]